MAILYTDSRFADGPASFSISPTRFFTLDRSSTALGPEDGLQGPRSGECLLEPRSPNENRRKVILPPSSSSSSSSSSSVVVVRFRPLEAQAQGRLSSSSSICGFWDCRRRCRFSAFGGPPSRLLASRGHGAVGRRRDRRPLRFLPFLRPPGAARGGAGEHAVRGRPRRAAPPGRARAPLRPPRPMRRARGIGEAKNMRGEGRR